MGHPERFRRRVELKMLPIPVEPGIFGLFRPVLLWPQGISQRLDDAQLEAVVAHEVCHVRRGDNITAAIHMAVEAVFWFHPLVWWLETRLVEERESACDEEVLQMCGQARAYAESILKVCEFCVESPLACVSGIAGADLRRRVADIIAGRVLTRMTWPKRLLIATTAVCVVAAPVVLGQAKAARRVMAVVMKIAPEPVQTAAHAMLSIDEAASAVPSAQTQQPKFEIADVHVSTTAPGFAQNFGSVLRGGMYINRDATMLELIETAYGVSEDAIAGGPGWLGSDLFDVIAKVPDGTTAATANLMLQNLLAERFGLMVHNETGPLPRYVLSVGKGSKLKPANGSGGAGCQPKQQSAMASLGDLASLPNIEATCHNLTAAAIADNLHQMAGGYLDHDVIDSTKLEGSWDFDLEWTPRIALAAKGSDGISIFDAVEKQLGLKLELQNVPLPSLAISSVNRKPSPNPSNLATALALPQARFEVAVVKPADPNAPPFTGLLYTGGSEMRAGGTLRALIALALQISPNIAADTVIGLPRSADTQAWDITAKVPSTGEGAPHTVNGRLLPPPLSIGLEMLRGLLLDQFELKTHTENREVTVYALTVNGKPKLIRADESERSVCKPDPNAPKPVPNIPAMLGCKNSSMDELAANLQRMANAYIDHPIVNATGLEGGWDFAIGWTPKAQLQPSRTPNADAGATSEASDPNGISVFEATERELGLKLVQEKRSIPVIVVDHVDEKPLN
jgi:uncharacterized protein (TIGR03435 family)